MDDLNIFHVLEDAVNGIGQGVQLTPQHDIKSKMMICFLDGAGKFHYGFGYKNGGNLRVAAWENKSKKLKTVPKGSFVIAFHDETTTKKIKDGFTAEDFEFDWFGEEAQKIVKEELISLIHKEDSLEAIVQGLCGLTIQQLDKVDKEIKKLKNE